MKDGDTDCPRGEGILAVSFDAPGARFNPVGEGTVTIPYVYVEVVDVLVVTVEVVVVLVLVERGPWGEGMLFPSRVGGPFQRTCQCVSS